MTFGTARNPTVLGSPTLVLAPPGMGSPASPRMRPTVGYHQTMPRHVSICGSSAWVVGNVWSGRQAIRYGPQPHRPGQPRPGARPTPNGLPASPRMHPTVGYHQTMPRHVSICGSSAWVVGNVWSGRQAIRYGPQPHRPGQPRPGARPTPNGLPASPCMRPTVGYHQTVSRHVSMCDTSARVMSVAWSGREAIRYGPQPHHPALARGAPSGQGGFALHPLTPPALVCASSSDPAPVPAPLSPMLHAITILCCRLYVLLLPPPNGHHRCRCPHPQQHAHNIDRQSSWNW